MPIRPTSQPPAEIEADWVAVGVFDQETEAPGALADGPAAALLARLRDSKDVTGAIGETVPVLGGAGFQAGALLLFGLGPRASFAGGAAYQAGVTVAKKLAGKPRARVAVVAPDGSTPDLVADLVCGLEVGQHGPDLRKAEPARRPFGELILVGPEAGSEAFEAAVRKGAVLGEAVNLARELTNTPPADKPPARLAARAREVAEANGFHAEVWGEDRLRRERFGGLLGVAAGSDQPPAFVQLEYRHGGDAPATALVGKGVTFDSGGLSLKPNDSMTDMKCDMTGAAVVLATFQAVARLGLPVNLLGYLPLTENLAGGRALKLGDVLTMRNGTTVEVLNTDAEGRLILADALAFAVEQNPGRVLDLATLTGACMVALGMKIAGLFSPDDAFAADLLAACARTGERAWRLPLDEDFDELLKSPIADLKNVGGRWGGAVIAAKFLQRFVGATPWAHLDIAGPSWADSDSSTRDAGGTGCFVRTLVALLETSAGTTREE